MDDAIDNFLFAGVAVHADGGFHPDGSNCRAIVPEAENFHPTFTLAFEDQGEHDHARLKLVDRIRILQIGVTIVNVLNTFADL